MDSLHRKAGVWTCVALAVWALPAVGQVRAPSKQSPKAKDTPRAAAPRTAQAPSPGAPARPRAPAAPFTLTPAQQQAVDKILDTWESKTQKVSTFKCSFTMWDYNQTFGDKRSNWLRATGTGQIKYKSPDHGFYRVASLEVYGPPPLPAKPSKKPPAAQPSAAAVENQWQKTEEGLDYWVCDGNSIYEFVHQLKQLRQTNLPPEMRGKAISDGPLPFVFGAKAQVLRNRYYIREVTPADVHDKQIWLEAFPRSVQDAGNFARCQIILSRADYLPYALQLVMPGKNEWKAYEFRDIKVNDVWANLLGDFKAPATPLGWKKIVQNPPTASAAPSPSGNQAKRPTSKTR